MTMASVTPRLLPAVAVLLLIAAACRGAAPEYTLRVTFNDRYTDTAAQAVDDAVRRYDGDAVSLVQPTYPPIVSVSFHTRDRSACSNLVPELKSDPAIASVECAPRSP